MMFADALMTNALSVIPACAGLSAKCPAIGFPRTGRFAKSTTVNASTESQPNSEIYKMTIWFLEPIKGIWVYLTHEELMVTARTKNIRPRAMLRYFLTAELAMIAT